MVFTARPEKASIVGYGGARIKSIVLTNPERCFAIGRLQSKRGGEPAPPLSRRVAWLQDPSNAPDLRQT